MRAPRAISQAGDGAGESTMTVNATTATIGAEQVYRGFIEALNRQDLEAAERFVDVERYRENCVGFTRGYVDWSGAKESVRQVWKGIPDLRVELRDILAGEDVAVAHGTARGTALGRLYGAPATKRSFEASFFDYVRIENAHIVERVQQADVLGQMRQMYGKAIGLVGLGAMFMRLPSGPVRPGD
jgi:predicted ester cyclase